MITSRVTYGRAPLRVGFVGGGTDTDDFMKHSHGAVLNSTINMFVHCWVRDGADGSADTFDAHDRPRDLLPQQQADVMLHQAAWTWFREHRLGEHPPRTIRLATASDVPWGSGLGASSALTVCILKTLYTHHGMRVSRQQLAAEAHFVERHLAEVPGGYQDHYAAAFGGMNLIRLDSPSRIGVQAVSLSPRVKAELESRIFLVFSGSSRNAAALVHYGRALGELSELKITRLKELADLAQTGYAHLDATDVPKFLDSLEIAAQLKRQTNEATSASAVRAVDEAALEFGASFCKPLGAGGGGYVMVVTEPEMRSAVQARLRTTGFEVTNLSLCGDSANAYASLGSLPQAMADLGLTVA